ncbi:hypothetical protein PBY51_003457 [Eleginops maclovinus]|uniref:Uncharacterized protein n=1 Tax=Eleginops maclovinus TaxID=56733 RepID=A0AAN7XY02_ELEMC|nr:hypothetical protein PBY51_003457 [Eleginops maclovinus]
MWGSVVSSVERGGMLGCKPVVQVPVAPLVRLLFSPRFDKLRCLCPPRYILPLLEMPAQGRGQSSPNAASP